MRRRSIAACSASCKVWYPSFVCSQSSSFPELDADDVEEVTELAFDGDLIVELLDDEYEDLE